MGSDDHLLGGVHVALEICRALHPTGMTRMHLEPAAIKRDEVIHLVQVMNLNAELFRKVEIVCRQFIFGVVPTADLTIAA